MKIADNQISILNFFKDVQKKVKLFSPGLSLLLLALTQVPGAIKTTAEIACIGEVSNDIWRNTKSHDNVNSIAVHICNGGDKSLKF